MVEVFKTDVKHRAQAQKLIAQIAERFHFKATFDLQDQDKVLRVISNDEFIESIPVIHLLNDNGFQAEVLPDICH